MSTASLAARIARLEKLALAAQPDEGKVSVPATALELLDSGAIQIKGDDGSWVPFTLWPDQRTAIAQVQAHLLCLWLKARQLGMTWLALAYALWVLLARPGVTVLLFSRRDDEACELLERLAGMHQRLPEGLRKRVLVDSAHNLTLGNGSRALAFPCTAGDSYTAALAIVDEAALVPNLQRLLGSVKPTIDNGGQLLLLSRANKSDPSGTFAQMYRAAAAGDTSYRPLFLPWSSRPDRTPEWYEQVKRDYLANEGSLDSLKEHYPATPEEALSARELDKRYPWEWIAACLQARPGKSAPDEMNLPGVRVWQEPLGERQYAIGADAAEGNPKSDDSAAQVLDKDTGEQVALLRGKIEPTVFASSLAKLSRWYHNAPVLPERNNHGHAVIVGLRSAGVKVLDGPDGKPGWYSTEQRNVVLYDALADALRERQTVLHDQATALQIASIEAGTLAAPSGEHDDLADSYGLAVKAAGLGKKPRRSVKVRG